MQVSLKSNSIAFKSKEISTEAVSEDKKGGIFSTGKEVWKGTLKGYEGVAIASKVADRVGVTRSVIVNALRKLESAGLIESRSLGMKGTYIKVLSPLLLEYLWNN